MWSQCVCPSTSEPLTGPPSEASTSAWPSRRAPVPQSNTTSVPLPERSSRQEVLPPYRTVDGPGVGIDPRVPQKRMRIPAGCQQGTHSPDSCRPAGGSGRSGIEALDELDGELVETL